MELRDIPKLSGLGATLSALILASLFAAAVTAGGDFLASSTADVIEFRTLAPAALAYTTTFVLTFAATLSLGLIWIVPISRLLLHGPAAAAALGLSAAICGLAATAGVLAPTVLLVPGALAVYRWVSRMPRGDDSRRFLALTVAAATVISAVLSVIKWAFHNPMTSLGLRSPSPVIAIAGIAFLCAALLYVSRRQRVWRMAFSALSIATLWATIQTMTLADVRSSVITGGDVQIPRVVFISLDTLRADALSCYNPQSRPTPAIDDLANDSVRFENAFSPSSWTLASMVSIMTGVSPFAHGVTLPMTDADLEIMPEYLRGAGYRTAAIIGNPVLDANPRRLQSSFVPTFRLVDGFEQVAVVRWLQRLGSSVGGRLATDLVPSFQQGANTDGISELAEEWIEVNADNNFFLWVHFADPHWPYAPPPEWLPLDAKPPPTIGAMLNDDLHREIWFGQRPVTQSERAWVRAAYQSEVECADAAVGRIVDKLKELNLYGDTLIILTSDHGEEFWEHGQYGHGHSLLSEVIRVPLIVRAPGGGGATVESIVPNRAILPTLIELTGASVAVEPIWAPSLASLWTGETGGTYDTPIINTGVMIDENQAAVLNGSYRYVVKLESGIESLYDIAADPGETVSLAAQEPEKLEEARAILESHRSAARAFRENLGLDNDEKERFDDETIKRLRSLGYL